MHILADFGVIRGSVDRDQVESVIAEVKGVSGLRAQRRQAKAAFRSR